MEYGIALIDKAGKVCGSFYRLSKETGFPEANISKIRKGEREWPLEWVPVLAEIAGVEAREALALAMAERLPEGSRARAILGGVRAAGVAVLLLFFCGLGWLMPSTGYAEPARKLHFLYIVECVRRWFERMGLGFATWPTAIRTGLEERQPMFIKWLRGRGLWTRWSASGGRADQGRGASSFPRREALA